MSSIALSINNQQSQDFNFKNLEPINYLKTFNKMLDYMSKTPVTTLAQPQKQMKMVRLTKFPLPQYYQKMEGIFQSSNRKNQDQKRINKQQKEFEKYQQKFLDKHYKFVKDTLEKIIQDNQQQQKTLNSSKKFYNQYSTLKHRVTKQQRPFKLVKLRSQPKLRSIKNSIDTQRKTQKQESFKNFTLKRKQTLLDQTSRDYFSERPQNKLPNSSHLRKQNQEQQEHNPIFKKLVPPKKNEKYRRRKFDDIDILLSARKMLQQEKKRSMTMVHPLTERKIQPTSSHNMKNNKMKDLNNHNQKIQNQRVKNQETGFKNNKFNLKDQILTQKFQKTHQHFQQEQNIFTQKDYLQFRKQIAILPYTVQTGQNGQNELASKQIQEEDQRFLKEVQILQSQQMKLQTQYATRIDSKIKDIKSQLNKRIEDIQKFDFSVRQKPEKNKNGSLKYQNSNK